MDPFLKQLNDVLTLYGKQVTEAVKADAKEVANETRRKIRNEAPKRTGDYRKNWAVKKSFESANEIRYTVYNKAPTYRLTHLLEAGHEKSNHAGRVGPTPPGGHIKPAEEWAQREFEKRIEKAVKG